MYAIKQPCSGGRRQRGEGGGEAHRRGRPELPAAWRPEAVQGGRRRRGSRLEAASVQGEEEAGGSRGQGARWPWPGGRFGRRASRRGRTPAAGVGGAMEREEREEGGGSMGEKRRPAAVVLRGGDKGAG